MSIIHSCNHGVEVFNLKITSLAGVYSCTSLSISVYLNLNELRTFLSQTLKQTVFIITIHLPPFSTLPPYSVLILSPSRLTKMYIVCIFITCAISVITMIIICQIHKVFFIPEIGQTQNKNCFKRQFPARSFLLDMHHEIKT